MIRSQTIVALLLAASSVTLAVAQSGRIKESPAKQTSEKSRSTAERERAATSTSSKKAPTPVKNPSDDIDEDSIVRVTSNLVPIPATVVDAKGIALTGLKMEDFELRVDGQIRAISEISRSESPVRLVMLFDNSGSLHMFRDFEKRAAVRFFRTVLRRTDEAAIFSVGSDSYLAQPLTNDIALLERAIESFGLPSGGTSLFDAIVDAGIYLRPYGGRRVLVIVSDGIETTSRHDFETTMQKVLAEDCQIFVVRTGVQDSANLRALAAERRMEQLAGQTGGAVYVPKTTTELDEAFQQIAADLSQQYVLSYYPGNERRDGSFHAIDLRVKAKKDVRVRARKGYYSPKSAAFAAGES